MSGLVEVVQEKQSGSDDFDVDQVRCDFGDKVVVANVQDVFILIYQVDEEYEGEYLLCELDGQSKLYWIVGEVVRECFY